MPILYLLMGTPGSGKTTVAQHITDLTGAVHLWADHERHSRFTPVTHTPEENAELYQALNKKAESLLAEGTSVVFDTNFGYRRDRDHLRLIAERAGAETELIWIKTPVDIARERALHTNHQKRNGYPDTMKLVDFDRLASHLEEPADNEKFMTLDGSSLDEQSVARQLKL